LPSFKKSYCRVCCFLWLSLACTSVQAQNLVPNSGFEQFTVCPQSFTQRAAEFAVPGWKPAGLGVPDYFHYCSRGEAGVPYNWAGVAEAYEGDGYAGIYLWMDDEQNYREYLQCTLLQPLIKDSTYYIEFHYKLSSYSNYCIDRIGLLFSDNGKGFAHDRAAGIKPTLQIVRDSALTKSTGLWEAARFEYQANGTETNLLIGNFSGNEDTKSYRIQSRPVSEPMLANAAYYYIDGVIVVPKFRIQQQLAAKVAPAFVADGAVLNTPYVLKNLQFEFNSASLSGTSFSELDHLADFLVKYPNVKVEVSGHTDDVGDASYNLDLSKKRSQSVAAYLISKGIESSRITSFGYGETEPLIQSISQDARDLNRRVEVRFVK
jgi:OOP family OmpA-OmpF porin